MSIRPIGIGITLLMPRGRAPGADTTPNAWTFTPVTDAEFEDLIEFGPYTVSGLGDGVAAPIRISGGGGEYRINGGSWVTADGTIENDDEFEVRIESSASVSTEVTTTLTIGGLSRTASVTTKSSPVTYAGPYHDDFSGTVNTLLDTRSVNGLAWTFNPGGSGVACPLKLTGTGELFGASTGASGLNMTYLEFGEVSSNRWLSYRTSLFGANTQGLIIGSCSQEQVYKGDGSTNSWDKVTLTPGGMDQLTTLVAASSQSGTAQVVGTTREQASNVYITWGDTITKRRRYVSSSIYEDLYLNGELVKTGVFDWATLGLTLNGRVGVTGNLGNASARSLSDIEVGDPAQHAMIQIRRPTHVAAQKADGSVPLWIEGWYSLAAPSEVEVFIRNAATDADVSGYAGIPLEDLAVDTTNKLWSGTIEIAAGDCPATFIIGVRRTDITPPAVAPISWSGIQRPGLVFLTYGQSLTVEADHNGLTGATAAVKGFLIDGSSDSGFAPATPEARRVARGPTNRIPSAFMENLAAVSGLDEKQIAYVRAGQGGTIINARTIGTTVWTAMLDGLRRAGNRVSALLWTFGEYEVTGSNPNLPSPFAASDLNSVIRPMLDDEVDAIEAICGYSVPVILAPVGSLRVDTATQHQNAEAFRRFFWDLAANYNPTRYKFGAYRMDIQGLTTDIYHNTSAGYKMQRLRDSWMAAYHLGYGSEHRRGPSAVSMTLDSATQITVTYALNGATSLEASNTGQASDFRLGQTFASDNTFTTGNQKAPTNAVVGTPAGGFCDVVYTFAASTWTGLTAYLRGPWGACPFSRNGASSTDWEESPSGTINSDLQARASMLRGVYANGDKVPVQPFYGAGPAGVDYLTDS